MSEKQNKKAKIVGLFVLAGFLALFGIIGHFMLSSFGSSNQNMVVMYFQESVKGLSVGSPVVLEGVEVGKVAQIELVTTEKTLNFSIPVYVKFQKLRNINDTSFLTIVEKKEKLKKLIENGLRARLATQSYLTGQLMIELVFLPDTPINLKRRSDGNIFEIPTTLSTIKEISQGFQELPLREMVNRSNKILASLEENLPIILPQITKLVETMNKVAHDIDKITPETQSVLIQTKKTLNNANQSISDIGAAARSIKNLTDYLERHPEAILKGKGK